MRRTVGTGAALAILFGATRQLRRRRPRRAPEPHPPARPDRLASHERRVAEIVRTAAADALARGAAELTVTTHRELDGDVLGQDWIVVLLTPRNPAAADLRVEVLDHDDWSVHAGDGPTTELSPGMEEDREEELAALVRAVVRGHYRIDWVDRHERGLLRPWRVRTIADRRAVFLTEAGPIIAIRGSQEGRAPEDARLFEPY